MASIKDEALAVLEKCAVFKAVPAPSLVKLAGLARTEVFENRTLLVANRARPEHLRHVAAGRIDLSLTNAEGQTASLPVGAGRWATWLGCFHPEPIEHEIWAAPGTRALAFPAREVRQTVSEHPQALMTVIGLIGDTTRLLIGWALASTLFSPQQRLAYMLLSMGGSRNAEGEAMRITQEQIGQMGLGTRQRVSRILHELAGLGLVSVDYGRVSIPSPDRLSDFVFGRAAADGHRPPHPGFQVGRV